MAIINNDGENINSIDEMRSIYQSYRVSKRQGTQRSKGMNQIQDYEEAKRIVHEIGFKSKADYQKPPANGGKRPKNLPSNPEIFYKDKGWKGYSSFLGTKSKRGFQKKDFVTYELFTNFLKENNIKSASQFFNTKKPENIPSTPQTYYKDKGWVDWGTATGTGRKKINSKDLLPFLEAREYVRNKNFNSVQEFRDWSYKGERPPFIPGMPSLTYKGKFPENYTFTWDDWIGLKDPSYQELKQLISEFKFNKKDSYFEFVRNNKTYKRYRITSSPDKKYINQGWISWEEFFGQKIVSNTLAELPLFDIDDSRLNILSSREKYILILRNNEKLTLEEIGQKLNVTRERIRQILKKIDKKLPQIIENDKEFVDLESDSEKATYYYDAAKEKEQDNPDEAIDLYTKSVELSNYLPSLMSRGLLYLKKNNSKLSIKDFSEVIKIKPDQYMAYFYRGKSYLISDELNSAKSDFQKVIELKPNNILAKLELDQLI